MGYFQGVGGHWVMIERIKKYYYQLPGWVSDALTGLFYASLITAVVLLSGADDAGFRYLEL